MNPTAARFLRLGVSFSGLVVLGWVLTGQAAKREISLPTDWSHSHVIFSQPASEDEARVLGEDPRYWQQVHRHEESLMLPAASDLSAARLQAGGNKIHRDWSQDLGSGASPGPGNYPAKYSFGVSTANCGSAIKPDYVVYSTGLTGSGTQASVVAYDNLYAGCGGGSVPTVYWAYNTGGKILTSPVLSLDGTQVAFVQTSGGQAGLVLLKWNASLTETVSLPGVPTLALSATLYRTCAAPCMYEVFLHDGSHVAVDDTTSSPFYDYTNDIVWVGGANGWLHKLTGVFKGTPTEVSTGGFPVQVNSSNPNVLYSPVYDHTSKNVFVGDAGGYFYRVASATAAVTKSAQLDHGAGLVESPLLDVTAGAVYVFSSSDGTTACSGVACAAVLELSTTFASGAAGTKATVGRSVVLGSTPNPLYFGAFDSTYFKSANATGNLYVCGNTGGTPTLYQVAVTAGTPANGVAGPVLSTSTTPCSPVTGFANPNATGGAAEWVFVSADTNGTSANPSACAPSGCIFNFKDTPWQASHAYTVGQEILDSHFQIQAVSTAGTSGAATPAFGTTVATTTVDGGVTWENQGVLSASTAAWKANTGYAKGVEIWDSNGNVELQTKSGTPMSGATAPAWSPSVGGTVSEAAGGPHWTNLGPIATYGLRASGGTGGIIIDNTVTGAVAGSQVYFGTRSNQVCGTSGTGGCAVQASQSKLQ